MKLIAARPLTYATRRLSAGDLFTASPRDARLLVALKRAREVKPDIAPSVPPAKADAPIKPKPKTPRKRRAKTAPKAS